MARVAVQLLSWNGSQYFSYLLDSLKNQTYTDWFLFVGDNGSTTEETAAMQKAIKESGIKNVLFESFTPNAGFAGGHNRLFAKHESEFVLLLNDDAILEPDYISSLIDFCDQHPEVSSASGRIYRWDFDHKDNARGGKTDIIDSFGLSLAKNGKVSDVLAGETDTAASQKHADRKVFGVSGCLPLYRRKDVLKTSPNGTLFDPTFVTYKEDVELAFRMQDAGFLSFTVGGATAHHRRSFNSQSRSKQSFANIFQSYRNHLWILIMHGFGKKSGLSCVLVAWFEFRKMVYWLVKRPVVVFRSFAETIYNLRNLLRKRAFFAKLRDKSQV